MAGKRRWRAGRQTWAQGGPARSLAIFGCRAAAALSAAGLPVALAAEGIFRGFIFLNIQCPVFGDQRAVRWSGTRSPTVLQENGPSPGCDSLEPAGVAPSRVGAMGRTGPARPACSPPCSPSWAWRTAPVFSSDALQREIFHSLCPRHAPHRAEARGVECRLLMGSFPPATPGEYEKSN